MSLLTQYPVVLLVATLAILWASTHLGAIVLGRRTQLEEGVQHDFDVVLAGTLTLLGLLIGFALSMAVNRYDQRKNLEEGEANAIGTEYLRADFLPPAAAAGVRALLKSYLNQRIQSYAARGPQAEQAERETTRLQNELWNAAREATAAPATPIAALVASGMNDVINAQGYAQAARLNRIPISVWLLMLAVAICGNALIGYGAHKAKAARHLLLVLPSVVALSFFLIADIDSPSAGIIRVAPVNLTSLAASLRAP